MKRFLLLSTVFLTLFTACSQGTGEDRSKTAAQAPILKILDPNGELMLEAQEKGNDHFRILMPKSAPSESTFHLSGEDLVAVEPDFLQSAIKSDKNGYFWTAGGGKKTMTFRKRSKEWEVELGGREHGTFKKRSQDWVFRRSNRSKRIEMTKKDGEYLFHEYKGDKKKGKLLFRASGSLSEESIAWLTVVRMDTLNCAAAAIYWEHIGRSSREANG